LGVAYGMKFPSGRYGRYLPLLAGGAAGTLADVIYAYNVSCLNEAREYDQARHQKALDAIVQEPESRPE